LIPAGGVGGWGSLSSREVSDVSSNQVPGDLYLKGFLLCRVGRSITRICLTFKIDIDEQQPYLMCLDLFILIERAKIAAYKAIGNRSYT